MSVRELRLDAEELKALRKDPGYDGGSVILVDVAGGGDRGTPSLTNSGEVRSGVPRSPLTGSEGLAILAAIERLSGPVVLTLEGPLDAIGLALGCACVATYTGLDTEIGPIEPADALALGLAGRLTERIGAAGAARLLLSAATETQPSSLCRPEGDKGQGVARAVGPTSLAAALGLVRPSADPLAGARALAARLDSPAGRLLPRSLAFAARSTRAQAAAYDAELLALLAEPQSDQ